MKTLKKVQISLLIQACIMLGTIPMYAQQDRNVVKGADQSATVLMPPSGAISLMGTSLASIDVNEVPVLEEYPPYYFYAGADVSVCNGESYSLSGINTSKAKAMWGTQGDGEFDNPYSLNAVYTPGKYDKKAGKVTVILYGIDPDGIYPYMITDSMEITLKDLCGEPMENPKK